MDTSRRKLTRVQDDDPQILGVVATDLMIGGYVPQIVHLVKETLHRRYQCSRVRAVGLRIIALPDTCGNDQDAVFVGLQTVNLVAGGHRVVLQEIRG
jgi:hypothetical protein